MVMHFYLSHIIGYTTNRDLPRYMSCEGGWSGVVLMALGGSDSLVQTTSERLAIVKNSPASTTPSNRTLLRDSCTHSNWVMAWPY